MHDFGWALEQLKAGKKVQREGWNGKGMYVVVMPAYPDGIAITSITAGATGIPEGTMCRFRPYLMLKNADGSFCPWSVSNSDVLGCDWDLA